MNGELPLDSELPFPFLLELPLYGELRLDDGEDGKDYEECESELDEELCDNE